MKTFLGVWEGLALAYFYYSLAFSVFTPLKVIFISEDLTRFFVFVMTFIIGLCLGNIFRMITDWRKP